MNVKQFFSDLLTLKQAIFHLNDKLLDAVGHLTYLLMRTKLKLCPVTEATRSLMCSRTGIHGSGEKVTPEYVYVSSGSP